MKKFNLEKALAGGEVRTNKGHRVRIISFDRNHPVYPIVALVEIGDTDEVVSYTKEGKHYIRDISNNIFGLVNVPEIKEGWLNIYKVGNCGSIHKDKETALMEAYHDVVDSIKITWEE